MLTCQVLQQKNLTHYRILSDTYDMKDTHKKITSDTASAAERVLSKIEAGGERVWRLADFGNMPIMAVAQALSRLSRQGIIQRIGKGLYYKARQTVFGESKPNTSLLRSLSIQGKGVFPAGSAAANFLGFSTQNAAKIEVATNGLSLPRLLIGKEAIVHTRRPDSWKEFSCKDAAILDFLRQRGEFSELSPGETVSKLLGYFREPGQLERLLRAALSEPPRVRAMLGAIGQELGCSASQLFSLRESLNPLSRFDFGQLFTLKYARQWQAKEHKTREAI